MKDLQERFKEKFNAEDSRLAHDYYTQDKILSFIESEVSAARKEARDEYRQHLCFLYRWISRLNGDKPHDKPEENWREYVQTIVNYPSSPWETGDWFEDLAPKD